MSAPSIADMLTGPELLVYCAECAAPLPTHQGAPVGATVELGTGEKLFWCSPRCLTRTTTRVRVGGDVCVVCAAVLAPPPEPYCDDTCTGAYLDGVRYLDEDS